MPWMSSKEIVSFELADSELGLTPTGAENGTRLVPAGTLLMVVRGMSLAKEFRVGVTTREVTFNQDVKALVPSPDIDSRFLARFLRYSEPRILSQTEASSHGTKRLPMGRLEALEVPLPPLEEQRRIAAILDKADAIRRTRQEAIDLTDELLRSTFLDMFGDPVTNPRGWPETELGELLSFLTSGSRGWAKYYAETGALFLRIQNVTGGRLRLDDVAYVNAPDSAEAKRTRVVHGDVLLSITADLGRTAVVPPALGDAHINQHLAILRPGPKVRPEYLSAFLSSIGGQRQFERLNRHGVKAGLNFTDVRGVRVLLPPLEDQDRFVRAERQVLTLSEHLGGARERSDQLFHSLVQRAFRGDL